MHTKLKTSKKHLLIILVLAISSLLPACENQKSNHDSLVGLGLGISSATVVVSNLDSARLHYAEDLGFDIPKPEKYTQGIYKGSIGFSAFFPDMSALEFITLKDSTAKAKRSFIGSFLKKQEGLRLYDLSTSTAKNTLDWLNTRGFAIDSVQEGRGAAELPKGWDWDDGGPQWRQVSLNPKNPPAHLPGFMEYIGLPYQDYQNEKTSIYAMNRTYSNHPNGAVGMTALRIVVDNLKAARKEFKKMGLTELAAPKSPDVVRFQVSANQELQLIAPQAPDDQASKFLKTRGPGVYAMRFEVKKLKATRAFFRKKLPAKALRMGKSPERLIVLKEYAHGVQLEFVAEPKAQALLAQRHEIKEGKKLNPAAKKHASALYQKYCALCHGKDREGYAADNAPSLRSHSLMSVTKTPAANYNFLRYTIAYGRQGTAMAAYAKDQGGPLEYLDIDLLITWLREKSGVKKPVELSTDPVTGDVALGKKIVQQNLCNLPWCEG